MSAPGTTPAPGDEPAWIEEAIARGRGLRIKTVDPERLGDASVAELLLYALAGPVEPIDEGSPGLAVLRAMSDDVDAFAALAVASANSARDLVTVSTHLGLPLSALARRLAVAVELLDREGRARRGRARRRAA